MHIFCQIHSQQSWITNQEKQQLPWSPISPMQAYAISFGWFIANLLEIYTTEVQYQLQQVFHLVEVL